MGSIQGASFGAREIEDMVASVHFSKNFPKSDRNDQLKESLRLRSIIRTNGSARMPDGI